MDDRVCEAIDGIGNILRLYPTYALDIIIYDKKNIVDIFNELPIREQADFLEGLLVKLNYSYVSREIVYYLIRIACINNGYDYVVNLMNNIDMEFDKKMKKKVEKLQLKTFNKLIIGVVMVSMMILSIVPIIIMFREIIIMNSTGIDVAPMMSLVVASFFFVYLCFRIYMGKWSILKFMDSAEPRIGSR